MNLKMRDSYSINFNLASDSRVPGFRSRNRTVMADYHSFEDTKNYSDSRPSSRLSSLNMTWEENLNLIQEDLKQNLLYPIGTEFQKAKVTPFKDLRSRLNKTAFNVQIKTAKALASKIIISKS